jgi:hypothetical protein
MNAIPSITAFGDARPIDRRYAPRSAHRSADKLLRTPRVAAALDNANAERARRLAIDGAHVLGELARLSFADLGRIIDWGPAGVTVKAAQDLAQDDRVAIAAIEAVSNASGTRVKVKLFDKLRALDVLAKHVFAREARGVGGPKLIDGRDARDVLRERFLQMVADAAKSER